MFVDVTGFTCIGERLDPEDVHEIMDGCFKVLMDEIHRYEGAINQFTGDGVMALFGAPMATRTLQFEPVTPPFRFKRPWENTGRTSRRTMG